MSSFASPMQPVAPPAKKVKAGINVDSDDSVRKRRDELDRLRQKQQMRSAQSRGTLKAAPPPPGVAPIDRVRHSDIFPGVDKVSKTTKDKDPPRGPPPPKSRMQAPPPRRLDKSFERRGASHARAASPSRGASPSRAADRSKSAPPSRPPPPPGPPPGPKEAPDSTPGRGFTPRPPPMTPGVKTAKPKPPPIVAGPPVANTPPLTPKGPPIPASRLPTPTPPPPTPSTASSAPPITPRPPGNAPPTPTRSVPGGGPPTPPQPPTPRAETQTVLPPPLAAGSAPPTPTPPAPPKLSAPPMVPYKSGPVPVAAPAPAPVAISAPAPAPVPVPAPLPVSAPILAPPPAPAPVPVPLSAPLPASEPEMPPKQQPPPLLNITEVKEPEKDTKADVFTPPPGPAALPSLVVEESATPATLLPDVPAQSRQNLIRNMHEYAETPSKPVADQQDAPKNETSLLRLEKEVREHEKAKAEALRRVVELEEEVQKLKEQGALSQILTETPKASTAQVGFFSPLSPGLATPRANSLKRVATPHPKHRLQKMGGAPKDKEERRTLFSDAVQYTPFEYATELATFIIRRPYGKATERELWFQSGYLNSKQYEKTADVNRPETLEIVAQIGADGSTLALHGSSFVRHRSADDDADWKEFGDADELEQPLGSITYIDSDASEKDYSLDDVFSGAESARENYCTSVVSMGVGLKAKAENTRGKKSVAAAPPVAAAPAPVKKQTAEVGVGTEDLPFPDPAAAPDAESTPPANDAPPEKAEQERERAAAAAAAAFEEDEGSDTISLFVGAFGSLLVWILKTVFVTFPITVVSFILATFLFFAAISLISLQFADDNGSLAMGAGMDTMFNRPGIV